MPAIINQPKGSNSRTAEDSEPTPDGYTTYPLGFFLDRVKGVVVTQKLEKMERATEWMSFGCCKVETENRYQVEDMDSGEKMFICDEESAWWMRNPFFCCDCICFGCNCNWSTNRPFTLNLATSSKDCSMVLQMKRPCYSNWLPCFLQTISVHDKSGYIGCVKQRASWRLRSCTLCGLFEVKDKKDKVIYSINTSCVLSPCCNTQTEFDILDKSGKKVGGIGKQPGGVQGREAVRDLDRFFIIFPINCSSQMKAVLMGALFLLDFLFFED